MCCREHRLEFATICTLAAILSGCCHYPKARMAKPLLTATPTDASVTIVAYGDTRTSLFGLGDNAREAIHGEVVSDIFKNDGRIDAVIFTGDAVMTNFFLWKSAYWRCFLSQSNRFRDAGIKFYPSLGNHEVLPDFIPGLTIDDSIAVKLARLEKAEAFGLEDQLSRAYDLGEESMPMDTDTPGPGGKSESFVDPNSKRGQATLKRWERGASQGNAEDAEKFGQFERHLQTTFYGEPLGDRRCDSDTKTFADDYLLRAKYGYLKPLLRGHSYYSTLVPDVPKGGVQVKLIALDTNCLDSVTQQKFFEAEVNDTKFKGPIIVFGHHPPVNYKAEGKPWDKVLGWGLHDNDPLKKYISLEPHRVALWVFGHVHDYQRRGPAGGNLQAVAPVLLVAGGGGASPLDPKPAAFQWQPDSWPVAKHAPAYSQVQIVVSDQKIDVKTWGRLAKEKDFKVIDAFSIPLSK